MHAPTRAIVLCPSFRSGAAEERARVGKRRTAGSRLQDARLAEAVGLAGAIGLEVRAGGIILLGRPKPATLFGMGKVEELRGIAAAEDADIAIVDHPLTPVQQRNLEKAWKLKVIDRTGLILEIFGERARTREGRLQVELAHLTYQKSRLVRSWTHLERQRGGVGFLGGPGETQIEADRRALQDKIVRIRRELDQVKRTRALHRESRKRVPYAVVALVGYTNAGKSTLFNTLTGANVGAEDMLFATLDPTMRAIDLPHGTKAILSDTVGFISNLPTGLVAAFRATLEEVLEADLILHVRDISSPETEAQCADVYSVLDDLGIDAPLGGSDLLEVLNKIDLLEPEQLHEVRQAASRVDARAICVSAATGDGLDVLRKEIEARLNSADRTMEVSAAPDEGAKISWLHDNARVIHKEQDSRGNALMRVRMTPAKQEIFKRRFESGKAAAGKPR